MLQKEFLCRPVPTSDYDNGNCLEQTISIQVFIQCPLTKELVDPWACRTIICNFLGNILLKLIYRKFGEIWTTIKNRWRDSFVKLSGRIRLIFLLWSNSKYSTCTMSQSSSLHFNYLPERAVIFSSSSRLRHCNSLQLLLWHPWRAFST